MVISAARAYGGDCHLEILVSVEVIVKSTLITMRNIVGTAGLVFAFYVLAGAVPDLRRYLRIARM
jgi:hypothetical protein